MFKVKEKIIDLGDGRIITLETGRMARQADGSVLLKMGKTMLLATVVAAKEAKEDTDFMPLSVEYKEKYASTGRFPGGFLKREARASDYEILVSRLVDRALRPLFPDDFHAETFVTINLVSADLEIIPDALAGLAASAALAVSDIPFNGPISEVRAVAATDSLPSTARDLARACTASTMALFIAFRVLENSLTSARNSRMRASRLERRRSAPCRARRTWSKRVSSSVRVGLICSIAAPCQ